MHPLEPSTSLDRTLLLLVSARIGATRLIDNVTLSPVSDSVAASAPPRKELV